MFGNKALKALALSISAVFVVVAAASAQDLAQALSGKTLVAKNTEITVNENGKLSGTIGKDKLEGAWKVEGNQWCRTITAPVRAAGSDCQAAKLEGNILTITRADGSSVEFVVQ